MDIQNDPTTTRELIDEFCKESSSLIHEMETILEELEQNVKPQGKFEKFGQLIDRIMGAAKSFNANEIADFCELGKIIGYKADQTQDPKLLRVVVAILFDATYLLEKMITSLKTGDANALHNLNTHAFATRLRWLSDKFKHIERGSCAYSVEEKKNLTQNAIDDLIKSLGL
ncbi:MAG: hypothetical protein HQK53_01580 [Oligoflexia bacterium]|nr:hypothetical protein [Oligoflexia bacterium]